MLAPIADPMDFVVEYKLDSLIDECVLVILIN